MVSYILLITEAVTSETIYHFTRFLKLPACVQEIIFTLKFYHFIRYTLFSVCPFLLKNAVLPAKTENNIPGEIVFCKVFHLYIFKMVLKIL